MIEAIAGKGAHRVRAVCDECGRDDVLTCDYHHRTGGAVQPNVGQAHKKLTRQGWIVRGEKLHCPACAARRRAMAHQETISESSKGPETMEALKEPALREPTPKQKREIIGLLEIVYDDAAKRFKDGESDKTVAEAIGGGVMFGWVARIREELFGPDLRNQEVEALRKDLGKLADDIQAHQAELRGAREAVKAVESNINAMVARMAALKSRVEKVA